ncbi:MAG: rubrerythrin family protein [Firmicutes bacterium]|nr:rubrerythrin family protein [Bacillota bacterium]
MSLKGTRTEKNVLTAFAGESQARNRYTYYASQAKKEGYVEIAELFEETANQEKEHAKRLFKMLEGGHEVEIQAGFPAGKIGNTAENLEQAAAGENFEWTKMYPEYAKIAREEGFADIAKVFEAIAVSEKNHEQRFNDRLAAIKAGTVLKKDKAITWICHNCGYVYEGTEPPATCPACAHPQGYFAPLNEPSRR